MKVRKHDTAEPTGTSTVPSVFALTGRKLSSVTQTHQFDCYNTLTLNGALSCCTDTSDVALLSPPHLLFIFVFSLGNVLNGGSLTTGFKLKRPNISQMYLTVRSRNWKPPKNPKN